MQTMPLSDHQSHSDSIVSSVHSETGIKAKSHRPLMHILGIDPGVANLGWAVISRKAYVKSGTLIPKKYLVGIERQLWILSKLQDIINEYQPDVIAYEEFMWRTSDDKQERYVNGRPAMERIIGGIQALALFPPYPTLIPLLPQKWGKQLFGQVSHTKQQIAWVVNQRLGTSFKGDRIDNHAADATGIALVACDLMVHNTFMKT